MQFILAHHGSNRAFLQRRVHKIVAIEAPAFNSEEQFSPPNGARVDGVRLRDFFADSQGGCPHTRRRGNELRDLRERQLHARFPTAGSHSNPAAPRTSRATSTSSKGIVPSRVTCTFSWPLPASRTISPGRASLMASAIALRRSTSTLYFTPVF